MIHIKVIGAENLLLLPDKLKKTRISCYSYSSFRYYYGTFKSKEKTTTPEFDAQFDVDLFRAIGLTFSLFSSDETLPVSLIGNVNIDLPQFLIKGVGKRMLDKPSAVFAFKFPITASVNEKPFLVLQMSYTPKEYEPILIEQFKELPIVHLWATYDPPVSIEHKTPVEIELLQAYPVENPKSKIKLGYYFHLNQKYSWESVGKSSTNRPILASTGLTQIHSFSLPKIQNKYNFLILNVTNYTGVIKLNFVGEEKGKITNLGDSNYINLQDQVKVGIIKTVEIPVKSNTKYCAPVLLCYNNVKGKIAFAINGLDVLANTYKSDESLEEPDCKYSEREFHLKIIEEAAKIIPALENVNFKKTSCLPKFDPISITKTFQDYNLPLDNQIRLYLGSSIPYNGGGSVQIDEWHPVFAVYNKATGARCPDVEKQLSLRPNLEFPTSFWSKSFLHFKFNAFVKLDFNKIDHDNIIIFAMGCSTNTKAAPHGIFLITHYNSEENETLFFRNIISSGSPKIHYVVCFRLEYLNDEWQIIPMRHYFRDQKKMNQELDSMYLNRWALTQSISQINDTFISESSDGEPLTLTAKAKK